MIRAFTTVLLILSCLTATLGQEWDDTCEEAIARANKDFENGTMKSISYGLIIAEEFEFENFYDNYLLEKFGIQSYNGGCLIIESEECYSSRMYELIKDKFGQNFFKRTRKEAEKLYPHEIKKFSDLDGSSYSLDSPDRSPYIVVDIRPEFPGGFEALYEYVDNKIAESPIQLDSIVTRTFVAFVIDSTGQSKNIEILKGSEKQINSALVDILTKMPLWRPGIKQGKRVDTKLVLPFSY
ncbi:MAG: energy transducer TonB [Fulvivirga sp.]